MAKRIPDARTDYRPERAYVTRLVAQAADVIGSRNLLAEATSISRRRIQYLEAGQRTLPSGERIAVDITYPEQYLLEAIVGGTWAR